MKLQPLEIQGITTFKPLTHAELQSREQSGGFAATLEEVARADALKEKPTGPEWWLEKILEPLRNQSPATSEYKLAKTENEARRGLSMAPNPDSLFKQYLQEELEKLGAAGEVSDEMMAAIIERVQARVEAEVEAWLEALEQKSENSTEQQQLAQFDVMQKDLSATISETLPTGGILAEDSPDKDESAQMKTAPLQAQEALGHPDADTLLEQIRQAQSSDVKWVVNH